MQLDFRCYLRLWAHKLCLSTGTTCAVVRKFINILAGHSKKNDFYLVFVSQADRSPVTSLTDTKNRFDSIAVITARTMNFRYSLYIAWILIQIFKNPFLNLKLKLTKQIINFSYNRILRSLNRYAKLLRSINRELNLLKSKKKK